jgi:hypothetical protein
MKTSRLIQIVAALAFCQFHSVRAFEGRIAASLTRGGDVQPLLYTVGANYLRVEQTRTDQPHPRDIVNLKTGELTLVFPHNRSFMRLKNGGDSGNARPPGGMSAPPLMASPSAMPAPLPLPSPSGMPAVPLMSNPSAMPALRMESLRLQSTGETTNLLGFACVRYEIKQHGETMEIWATDQLLPFPPYVEMPPHRFGPRMLEEQWGGLLQARKLFPLAAVLKFDNGAERWRFAVRLVQPQKLTDADGKLFLPPDGYNEIPPLPF